MALSWPCRCNYRPGRAVHPHHGRGELLGLKVESSAGYIQEFETTAGDGIVTSNHRYTDPASGHIFTPDLGWDYNPGEASWQPNLDKYDLTSARTYLTEAIKGPDFNRFFREDVQGDFPVAVLDAETRDLLGARDQTVWFSSETLLKNRMEHMDLGIEDYYNIPLVLENPGMVIENRGALLCIRNLTGVHYVAVVKATQTKSTLFLTSFRITNAQDIERMIRQGVVLLDKQAPGRPPDETSP